MCGSREFGGDYIYTFVLLLFAVVVALPSFHYTLPNVGCFSFSPRFLSPFLLLLSLVLSGQASECNAHDSAHLTYIYRCHEIFFLKFTGILLFFGLFVVHNNTNRRRSMVEAHLRFFLVFSFSLSFPTLFVVA